MKKFEETWMAVGALAAMGAIALIVIAICSDHRPQCYYLTSDSNNNQMMLGVSNNWATDDKIPLVGVTFEKAVMLVDSLNSGLIRNCK